MQANVPTLSQLRKSTNHEATSGNTGILLKKDRFGGGDFLVWCQHKLCLIVVWLNIFLETSSVTHSAHSTSVKSQDNHTHEFLQQTVSLRKHCLCSLGLTSSMERIEVKIPRNINILITFPARTKDFFCCKLPHVRFFICRLMLLPGSALFFFPNVILRLFFFNV